MLQEKTHVVIWLPLVLISILSISLIGGCRDSDDDLPPPIDLPDADLPDADLPDVDLPDVDLPDVDLPDVDLPDADLPDADLPDVDLPDADLPDVEPPDDEPSGTAVFDDFDGPNSTVQITVINIDPPTNGDVLVAWLVNNDEDIIETDLFKVGTLDINGGTGIVTATKPGDDGNTDLIFFYDTAIVSVEADGDATSPSADVVLSGQVPEDARTSIIKIVSVADETPGGRGYANELVRLIADLDLVVVPDAQEAVAANDLVEAQNLATTVYNTIVGVNGVGILDGDNNDPGLITWASDESQNAQDATPTTAFIQTHAPLLRECAVNATTLAGDARDAAQAVVDASDADVPAAVNAMETAVKDLLSGTDDNDNANAAYCVFEQGQRMATIPMDAP